MVREKNKEEVFWEDWGVEHYNSAFLIYLLHLASRSNCDA